MRMSRAERAVCQRRAGRRIEIGKRPTFYERSASRPILFDSCTATTEVRSSFGRQQFGDGAHYGRQPIDRIAQGSRHALLAQRRARRDARLTLTALAENALRAELQRLKDRYNQGKEFPRRESNLKGGRPIAA
jgi:hypothetical protein